MLLEILHYHAQGRRNTAPSRKRWNAAEKMSQLYAIRSVGPLLPRELGLAPIQTD